MRNRHGTSSSPPLYATDLANPGDICKTMLCSGRSLDVIREAGKGGRLGLAVCNDIDDVMVSM